MYSVAHWSLPPNVNTATYDSLRRRGCTLWRTGPYLPMFTLLRILLCAGDVVLSGALLVVLGGALPRVVGAALLLVLVNANLEHRHNKQRFKVWLITLNPLDFYIQFIFIYICKNRPICRGVESLIWRIIFSILGHGN